MRARVRRCEQLRRRREAASCRRVGRCLSRPRLSPNERIKAAQHCMTVTENIMSAMEKLNASPEETCRYGSAMSLKHATCRSFASTTECQQMPVQYHGPGTLLPAVCHITGRLYLKLTPLILRSITHPSHLPLEKLCFVFCGYTLTIVFWLCCLETIS